MTVVYDFFSGCTDTASIKARYRELCRKHHPDLGGDTATMQALNAAYDQTCKSAQREERPGRAESAYEWYAAADTAVRDAIGRIVTLPGIEIEVCGWWVWVSGDTRAVKEQLKAAGYKWAHHKGMWYYPGAKSSGKGTSSMDEIRSMYGSERVRSQVGYPLGAGLDTEE